jgi:hypothetical protein
VEANEVHKEYSLVPRSERPQPRPRGCIGSEGDAGLMMWALSVPEEPEDLERSMSPASFELEVKTGCKALRYQVMADGIQGS